MAKFTLEKIDPVEKAKRNAKRAEFKKAKSDKIDARSTNQMVKILPKPAKPEQLQKTLPALAPCGAASPTPNKGVLETSPEGPSLDQMRISPNCYNRYIPSTIKGEVYMRDKGKCTHPNCNTRRFLEYDHIKPLALGGKTNVSNLRLLCRAHNQRAAIERFGLRKMGRYLKDQKTNAF